MNNFNNLVWVLVLLISMNLKVHAQSFVEDVLKEPIQHAISENAEVRLKQMEGNGTQMEMETVQAKRLPQISLIGGYGYLYAELNNEFPTHYLPITGTPIFEDALVSNFQTQVLMGGVSARQVIFAGNQISQGIKALAEKEKAERFLAEAGKEEIAKEVILTFDQLMLLHEVDKLLEDSEKRLEKEHAKVLKAIENGLAIPYDRDKIKLAILELEEKRVEADGNKSALKSKLQYLTGLSPEEIEQINYELQTFLVDKESLSLENRAELNALESGRKAKEHVVKKEKGGKYPTVFAFGNLAYVDAFETSVKFKDVPIAGDVKANADHIRLQPAAAVGVGLKWDIFKGGANRKKIAKAEIDLEMSEIKLNDTREKLEVLLNKNKIDLNTAEKRVLVADQKMVMANNNLNLATKQYNSGLIDITERLSSENEFYKVNLNYYNQILNQRSAAVELLLGTGELLDKIFDEYEN